MPKERDQLSKGPYNLHYGAYNSTIVQCGYCNGIIWGADDRCRHCGMFLPEDLHFLQELQHKIKEKLRPGDHFYLGPTSGYFYTTGVLHNTGSFYLKI